MLRRIAIMALLAAMADAGAARAGTLNVTVSRSADGSPVDGALVTVVRDGELPISNRSGMTGLVVFTNLAEGVYRVAVADAPDLASEVYDNRPLVSSDPALQPFDGVEVSSVGTKTITLALEPGGAIAGAVHDLRTGITHRDRMIDVERLRPDGGLVEAVLPRIRRGWKLCPAAAHSERQLALSREVLTIRAMGPCSVRCCTRPCRARKAVATRWRARWWR